jgi:hypothetical protein
VSADKWNIIEDFACRLSPDDPESGRAMIGAMTASLARWLQPKLLLRQKTMLSIGIGLVPITGFAVWTSINRTGAGQLWPWAIDLSLIIAFVFVYGLPSTFQQIRRDRSNRAPFNDPALQPIRDYIDELVASTRPIFDGHGDQLDHSILASPWASLLFTGKNELRGVFVGSERSIFARSYPDGLFVLKPKMAPIAVQTPAPAGPNITSEIEQGQFSHAPRPASKPKPKTKHWLALVTKRNFRVRLKLVLQFWPFPQRTQVEEMLVFAHGTAFENPFISKPGLKRLCVEHLKAQHFQIGLGEGREGQPVASDEWIDQIPAGSPDIDRPGIA